MDDLRKIVKGTHVGLLATINVGVVMLFWGIGNKLNELAQGATNSVETDDNFVSDISRDFEPIFGSYFDMDHLTLMKRLAEKCSLQTISQIAAAINLNYIPSLLNLEDEKAYLFYMRLIHIKSLSPDDLNREIIAGTFKTTAYSESVFSHSYSKPFYSNSAQLYFGRENVDTFRTFLEAKNTQRTAIDSLLAKENLNKTQYQTIIQLIQDCQFETQYELNAQFNTLLWEVGNVILAQSSEVNTAVQAKLIEQCIRELNKDFPSIFNASDLPCCVKFAQDFKDEEERHEMAETVSWEYIKIILGVGDAKKQLFIANEVLMNAITIEDLKGLLSNGCFDFMATSIPNIEPQKTNAPVIKEVREDNVIVELTEYVTEPKIVSTSDVNRNLFQNAALLRFIQPDGHLK